MTNPTSIEASHDAVKAKNTLDTISDRLCLNVLIWHSVVHCRREIFSVSSTGNCTAPLRWAVLLYQIHFGVTCKSSCDLSLRPLPAPALWKICFSLFNVLALILLPCVDALSGIQQVTICRMWWKTRFCSCQELTQSKHIKADMPL